MTDEKISLNNFCMDEVNFLTTAEKKQLLGGIQITGIRWDPENTQCLCDYDYDPLMCEMPCRSYFCAQAFPEWKIPF